MRRNIATSVKTLWEKYLTLTNPLTREAYWIYTVFKTLLSLKKKNKTRQHNTTQHNKNNWGTDNKSGTF